MEKSEYRYHLTAAFRNGSFGLKISTSKAPSATPLDTFNNLHFKQNYIVNKGCDDQYRIIY